MRYFYIKAKERNPGSNRGNNSVTLALDHKHGEAGIVNIADSCEAAVRAMDHPTSEKNRGFCA